MVRVVIDGNVFDSPDNWIELNTSFKRDDDINTILVTTDGSYDFSGEIYNYLNGLINSEGFCTSVDISFQEMCDGNWVQTMKGNIFLSDCIVNEKHCSLTTTVQDASFYAKINNNKKIKTSPQAGRSKNNVAITPAPTYDLDVYRPSNDSLLLSNVPAIRVYDLFRYFVDFLSDGSLTFTSNTFDVGGDWEGLCIVNGERLRLNTATAFTQFSFETLFQEINNKIPLTLAVEESNNSKIVRIESSDYFDQDTILFNFTDIDEIVSRFDNQSLYSVIKFGGEVFDSLNYFTPEQLPLFGFKNEEFGILGVCNIDNTLDLSSDWIASPNIIYQITAIADQSYDSSIILIDSILSTSTTGRTRNTNYFNLTPPQYTYNEGLSNYETSLRLFGRVPNSIASFFEPQGTGTFKSFIDTTIGTIVVSSTISALPFPNVVYNISSYFDGTDSFIAGLNGVYENTVLVRINVSNPSTGIIVRLWSDVYNPSNVLVSSQSIGTKFISLAGTYDLGQSFSVSLGIGFYNKIRFEILPAVNPIALTFDNSSYWEVAENSLSGGIFETYNPDDYPVRLFQFDYPITKSEFENIISAPYGFVTFAQKGQNKRKGRIKIINYNRIKGLASITLQTDKSTIDAS